MRKVIQEFFKFCPIIGPSILSSESKVTAAINKNILENVSNHNAIII